MHPQRVDREVGEVGEDRHAQLLLAPHASEHERRERVHRHDRVGPEVLDRALQLAAGQPGVDHHRGRAEQRRHLVAELVAPRRHAQLHLVEPAQQRPDVERDRVEEVDDLDPVPRRLETPPELLGRAVVARAHGRGDDEDAPAHEIRDYRPRGMAAVLLALGAALAYAAASVLQQREAEADDGRRRAGSGRRRRPPGAAPGPQADVAGRPGRRRGRLRAPGPGPGGRRAPRGAAGDHQRHPLRPPGERLVVGPRLGRADFAWACILAIGLTVFLLLAGTDGGRDSRVHRGLAGVRRDRDTGPRRVHGRRGPLGRHPTRRPVRVHDRRALRSHRRAHEVERRAPRPPRLRRARPTGSRTRSSSSAHSGSS